MASSKHESAFKTAERYAHTKLNSGQVKRAVGVGLAGAYIHGGRGHRGKAIRGAAVGGGVATYKTIKRKRGNKHG